MFVSALFVTSCTKEEQTENLVKAPSIVASQENNPNTKTLLAVNEGVGTIYWQPAEDINVFFGTTSVKYTSTNTENVTTAAFETSTIIGSSEGASTNIWGLYPYNSEAVCNGSKVTTTIPSTQYGVPETFDKNLFPTLAHSTTKELQFLNVCGGIKFSLSRADITKITFEGNNGETLAGKVDLTFVDNVPAATSVTAATKITLTPKTGSTFSKDVNYYIITLPVSMTGGFTMTFETATQIGTFNYTAKAVTVSRSKFSKKENIDTYATYTTKNIYFEDELTKAICVGSWDTNGDGELSYLEAESVTDIGEVFYKKNISNFTEFQYFTGVKSIPSYAFYSCCNLKSISLPPYLETIKKEAFYNCSEIDSLKLPNTLALLESAFGRCTATVTINSDVKTSYQNNAFNGFKGEVIISEGVTSIPNYCFRFSNSTKITLPSSLTSVGNESFWDCTGELHLNCNIPNGEYEWSEDEDGFYNSGNCWLGGNNFSKIIIGDNVTSLGDYSFYNCKATEIVLGQNVNNIGKYAFSCCYWLKTIRCHSYVAPEFHNRAFEILGSYNGVIYYPSGAYYSDWVNALEYYNWSPNGLSPVNSISINKTKLTLPVGYCETLSATVSPTDAYNYSEEIIWSSSDNSVVKVSASGVVTALRAGDARIYARSPVGSGFTAYCDISVTKNVDLGLSKKWTSCNVGADSMESVGYYFAWGEVNAKDKYTWGTYKYNKGDDYCPTKYNCLTDYGVVVDYKTTLDATDDAASVILGSGYRIPTKEEWQELINYCTWEYVKTNGIWGYKVTSKIVGYTDQYLFLPCAGMICNQEIQGKGIACFYWTPYSGLEDGGLAKTLNCSGEPYIFASDRYCGLPIRAIVK